MRAPGRAVAAEHVSIRARVKRAMPQLGHILPVDKVSIRARVKRAMVRVRAELPAGQFQSAPA